MGWSQYIWVLVVKANSMSAIMSYINMDSSDTALTTGIMSGSTFDNIVEKALFSVKKSFVAFVTIMHLKKIVISCSVDFVNLKIYLNYNNCLTAFFVRALKDFFDGICYLAITISDLASFNWDGRAYT